MRHTGFLRRGEGASMNSYEFTLVLDGAGYLPEDTIDALCEAAGGDVGIEHGPRGVFVTVARGAGSLAAAIARTVTDLEAVPGTTVVGVAQDDGVTLAEIARRLGRSREFVRLHAAGKRGRSESV
jgi:hypothetical protein